jgi:hypothetical protein
VEWFKIYKMPDGKPPNEFAFDGKPKVSKSLGLDVTVFCIGFHIDLISQRIWLADSGIFKRKTIRRKNNNFFSV